MVSELCPEEGEVGGNAVKKSRLEIPVVHLLLSCLAFREAGGATAKHWPGAQPGASSAIQHPTAAHRAGWQPAISASLLFAFPELSFCYCCLCRGLGKHESSSNLAQKKGKKSRPPTPLCTIAAKVPAFMLPRTDFLTPGRCSGQSPSLVCKTSGGFPGIV